MTAGIGPEGTPSASMGTKAPEVAELFADSGPATPGHRALPEFLGPLRELPLDRVGHEARDDVAEPGTMPIRKPSTVPRPMGHAASRHS